MPGFNSHYFFGNNTLQLLEHNYVKECCRRYPGTFCYGLQGPDIFFFCGFVTMANEHNLGKLIHISDSNLFFRNMFRMVTHFKTRREKEIGIAYMAGFLGHYVLDTNVHPFVYARTGYDPDHKDPAYNSRHIFLETDMDTLLLEKYTGLKPSQFRQDKAVLIPLRENKVVAQTLLYTIAKTYPKYVHFPILMSMSMYLMSVATHSLIDKTGRKKYLFRTIEHFLVGHPVISPLVPSEKFFFHKDPFNTKHEEWKNPWDKDIKSTQSFFDLYDCSETQYLRLLRQFDHVLSHKTKKEVTDFFVNIGNLSYHSGLDCSIPS
ncbi:MAG: zinc dependent phospholipase C family protein [Lachnospiraceae bacterium]